METDQNGWSTVQRKQTRAKPTNTNGPRTGGNAVLRNAAPTRGAKPAARVEQSGTSQDQQDQRLAPKRRLSVRVITNLKEEDKIYCDEEHSPFCLSFRFADGSIFRYSFGMDAKELDAFLAKVNASQSANLGKFYFMDAGAYLIHSDENGIALNVQWRSGVSPRFRLSRLAGNLLIKKLTWLANDWKQGSCKDMY